MNFEAYGLLQSKQFSIQLSDNTGTFPSEPIILGSNNTSEINVTIPNVPPGEYKIRVFSKAYYTIISNTLEITISENASNVFIKSPINESIDEYVSLDLTSETDEGASAYTFEIVPQGEPWESSIVQTGGVMQHVDSLAYNTVYKVRVKTDLTPNYGKAISFTTANAEDFTYVISPEDGAEDIDVSPTIIVNHVLYATDYTIELNIDPLFISESALVKSDAEGIVSFNDLDVNTKYYVRVKTNLSSKWGKVQSFTTAPILTLTYLKLPLNNAVDVSINPTLIANSVKGAGLYTIQLCTSDDFSSTPIIEQTGATNAVGFTDLEYNTKYYVRVGTNLFEGWGTVSVFTTEQKATVVTSIDLISYESDIKIYPNPFTDKLNISISSRFTEDAEISIYNINGQFITKVKASTNTVREIQQNLATDILLNYTIDLSGFSPGMYILKIDGKESMKITKY